MDNHSGTTQPMPTSFILTESRLPRPPIFAATKWIQVKNLFSGELDYIQQIHSDVETINTIDEIDISPFVLTTYQVNDYVLRRYPSTKIGGGDPHKYCSLWRGPYQVTQVIQQHGKSLVDKPRYTIRNLVTDKEYVVVRSMSPSSDPSTMTQLTLHHST